MYVDSFETQNVKAFLTKVFLTKFIQLRGFSKADKLPNLTSDNVQIIAASTTVQIGADERPPCRRDRGRVGSSPEPCISQIRSVAAIEKCKLQPAAIPTRALGQVGELAGQDHKGAVLILEFEIADRLMVQR